MHHVLWHTHAGNLLCKHPVHGAVSATTVEISVPVVD